MNDFRVCAECKEIEFQSEIDVLGVCIDNDMNFNGHGSLHLDLVLVKWNKSKRGPCDFY